MANELQTALTAQAEASGHLPAPGMTHLQHAPQVTADSGARTAVVAVAVSQGRVRPLLYQSPAEAYDPRSHDATFLVAGTPAAGAGDYAATIPAAAVRQPSDPRTVCTDLTVTLSTSGM
jgi:anti-sigma factor ChrR (cupin superfamily)